jgi:hypothetical protein
MCGAAHIVSPSSEKLGQFLFRARHDPYLIRVLAAARELNVVRDTFFVFILECTASWLLIC